jgi:phospholipase/carboxylesterase
MDIRSPAEPPVEIEIGPKPSLAVIWLHGLGADGHDFESIVPELRLPSEPGVRFIFPHAPHRPVTINGGYIMRAWYDIAQSDRGFKQNAEHIRESEKIVRDLIERENSRGIPSGRIVLAGFSQGGAIALHTGLRYPQPLAGLLSLSAPVPFVENLMVETHPVNADVPIFLAHGTEDPMVPYALAQQIRTQMEAKGLNIEWHAYVTGHSVVPEEIRDISRWFGRIFSINGGRGQGSEPPIL